MMLDRVDLAWPTPDSLTDVAARAASSASVRMALHRLDRRTLAVAWGVAVSGTTEARLVAQSLGAPAEPDDDWLSFVESALLELYRLGLVWRDASTYRPVRSLADVAPVVIADPRPVILDPVAVQTGKEYTPELVDRFAGQQGLAAVHSVRELLRGLESEPLGLTREGTVAIRELSARAAQMGVSDATAAMWLELGWLAGLLGPSQDGAEVLPTMAGEIWRTSPASAAWPVLAQAWWCADRDWSSFDRDTGVRPYVFGDSHVSTLVSALRRQWANLADQAGSSPVRNADEVLCDQRPLTDPLRLAELIDAVCAEAEALGITGRGALSSMGRALLVAATPLDPDDPQPENALVEVATPMLPAEIDTIVVQGDLTIVAPGPLVPQMAAAIGAFASIESTGGASVYRLSVASVEEALDRGWQAEQILALLRDHSQVPIPQPVEYLITDTAARHGRIRVGSAGGFVRTEDSASMELVLTALTKSGLPATRITDTVAVSTVSPQRLLAAIRAAGVAATTFGASGDSDAEPQPRVAPAPRPPAPVAGPDPVRVTALAAMLTAVATPEQSHELPPAPEIPRMHSAQVQAALAAALVAGDRMWLRYADNAGVDRVYLIQPLHLAGGVCEGFDLSRSRPRRFAVSRVVGVVQA